jgi:hypothetical protein
MFFKFNYINSIMSIEYFVFKTIRFLALITSILFLFLKYFALPSMVAVFFSNKNLPEGYLPKSQFFYLITFLLLIINLLTPLLINISKKIVKSTKQNYFEIFGKKIDKEFLSQNFENWINLIIAALNILVLLAILIISRLNSSEYTDGVNNYEWFSKLIIATILLIIIYPLIKIIFFKSVLISTSNDFN